jgi:hypothetical protein
MNRDGTDRKEIEGIETFYARFSRDTSLLGYITFPPNSQLIVYDWKNKTKRIALEESRLAGLF